MNRMSSRVFLAILIVALVVSGCAETADDKTADVVKAQQDWYFKYQRIPFYTYSLELASVIQIYNARNEARATNTFMFSMTGNVLFNCPSRGFPIPYGVQLTNSEYQVYDGGSVTLPQPEPNGLYSGGATTAATWILCSRADGLAAIYSEPDVMSFPFPVIEQNGRLVDIGEAASFIIDLTRPEGIPATNPELDSSIPQR